MKSMRKMYRGEGGFTLVELLVVIVILGVLAAVATLAVTRFIGRGNVEAARSEMSTAQTSIQTYMAECEIGRLNAADNWSSTWDGSSGAAAFAICDDHDPTDTLVGGEFRAIYTVNTWGEITSGTSVGADNPWPADVTWDAERATWE